MGVWRENMTSDDFDRNMRDWRDEQRREAQRLRILSEQYRREAERIEALIAPRPAISPVSADEGEG